MDRKQVVMSVPHNGTRSLMNHLQIFARDQGATGAGNWWHFGDHEHLIRKHLPHLHIPIRHPMDVAESWASRAKSGDPLGKMIRCYGNMLLLVSEGYPHTLHRVEDIPRTHGTDERVQEDRSETALEYQEALRSAIVEPHLEFFRRFYEDPLHGTGHLRQPESGD